MRRTFALPMNCWHASICWCTRGFVGARKMTLPFIISLLRVNAQGRSHQVNSGTYYKYIHKRHAAKDCCVAMSERHRSPIRW